MRERLLTLIIIAASFTPGLSCARPSPEEPMHFTTFWPCDGNASFCAVRILAEGVIQPDTVEKFSAFIRNRKEHKHELPPVPTIVFNSPGGSLIGGVALGRALRLNGIDVEVAKSYSHIVGGAQRRYEVLVENAICASACAIAFAGGANRSLLEGGRIGVHQFAGANGNIGDDATQRTMAYLASYLDEMGISRGILDRASTVPPASMAWLTRSEVRRFRLENIYPPLMPWNITPTPSGIAVLQVDQEIAYGKGVRVKITRVREANIVVARVYFKKGSRADYRLQQHPVEKRPEIDLCTEIRCIRAREILPWSRQESEGRTAVEAVVGVSTPELRELAQAKELKITDNFSRALSDISMETELSTEGLDAGIALLLRQISN